MKKIIPSLLFYTVFAAAVIFCFGFFSTEEVNLSQSFELHYKISNGLSALFKALPSIFFTGFLLGCSLSFGDSAAKAEHRFSSELAKLLKEILIVALSITLVISLCTLFFLPNEKAKQKSIIHLPIELNEYSALTLRYLNKNSPETALKYVERALSLDPQNERLNELKKDAENKMKILESEKSKERSISYAQTNLNAQKRLPDLFDESTMSVKDMLDKAKTSFAERDFFGAHYFAINALRLFQNEDSGEAQKLADDAWKELNSVQMEKKTDGMEFFRNKLSGYNTLINGDFVEAYYIFYGLSQEDARKERDPDVMHYLELARNRLLQDYFFIDETDDLSIFENVSNIYFTIQKPQGGYDIVLIRGVTEIEGAGGLVRYLRGLEIYSFDSGKNLVRSMKTPYAKMRAVKVADLTDSEQRLYVTSSSIKMIPQLQLCSLNRSSRAERNEPVYTFASNSNYSEREMSKKIYWPISYQDFNLIEESFARNGSANPFTIKKLSGKAPDYGFSTEGFNFAIMNQVFYPFMILIFLIFIAIIAWNYRLGANVIFKFKWIFILPLLNLILYFINDSIRYIIRILNFVFIAAVGVNLALLVGIVFYVLLSAAVIVAFLARKGD